MPTPAAMNRLKADLLAKLSAVHSALDDALGDSDIEYLDDEELRDAHPAQWAAMRLAEIIETLEK